jgi:fibronectin type 3 domain-containing protein
MLVAKINSLKRYLLASILILVGYLPLSAQHKSRGIAVVARSTGSAIKIRWAPRDPILWQLGNTHGYILERISITENSRMVRKQKTKLTEVPLRPAPQEHWEGFIERDNYVAVAAQAIFGKTFDLQQDQQSTLVKIVQKAKELDSRFSYALFSADQSVKAAELSGLYFEDATVAPFAKYLYRVYADLPDNVPSADTGIVFIGLQDHYPLPPVSDLRANFDDRRVMLSWNTLRVEKLYTSFLVERSQDGVSFKRITEEPIVNTFSGDQRKTTIMYKSDSLPSNEVRYYYRVKGVNAFGEIGPASDTVNGFGRPTFAYSATISSHVINDDGSVGLHWRYPREGEDLLSTFTISRLEIKSKRTHPVFSNVKKALRSVVDHSPRSSNYYVVTSVDRFGRTNNSFPYLVQLEDSIPPSSPTEVTGKIDSLGRVHLRWKMGDEPDLLGYGIYRANALTEEFIQVPTPILETNSYVDTIGLNNLSETIHYRITAIDRRYNPSEFSKILTLEKPDLVPPVPPVFTRIENDSLGISISWLPGGSEDIVRHEIYRRSGYDSLWTLTTSIIKDDTTTVFVDTDVQHNIHYFYTMISVDDDGLESAPINPVAMTRKESDPYPKVEEIFFTINKELKQLRLKWIYGERDVSSFLIYKSIDGRSSLFKSVNNAVNELVDDFHVSAGVIEYRVAARFRSGEKSPMSKAVVVKPD